MWESYLGQKRFLNIFGTHPDLNVGWSTVVISSEMPHLKTLLERLLLSLTEFMMLWLNKMRYYNFSLQLRTVKKLSEVQKTFLTLPFCKCLTRTSQLLVSLDCNVDLSNKNKVLFRPRVWTIWLREGCFLKKSERTAKTVYHDDVQDQLAVQLWRKI